jgi:hypothetical protein
MTDVHGPFAGVAPKAGWITVVLLDAPGRRGPLRFTTPVYTGASVPHGGPATERIAWILAADRAVRVVLRRIAAVCGPSPSSPPGFAERAGGMGCNTAILGYIPCPRRAGALRINELGTRVRLRWAEAGWPGVEVSPLWLAPSSAMPTKGPRRRCGQGWTPAGGCPVGRAGTAGPPRWLTSRAAPPCRSNTRRGAAR